MAGIYIHIPFCKRKCTYCDFYSVARLTLIPKYVDTLILEAENESVFWKDEEINTIYFGGGSPGLLEPKMIERIISVICENFNVKQLAEITIELNPENVSKFYLEELKKTGINRISLGVQSLCNEHLNMLGRKHSAIEAIESIKTATLVGFGNISADVIFGIPGLSESQLQDTLRQLIVNKVSHISAYLLTPEEKTLLHLRIRQNRIRMPDEETCEKQYRFICEFLKLNGFEHYEISNFAQPHYHSIHNSSYWNGSHYLGLGSAAHSYNGMMRKINPANVDEYIIAICQATATFSITEELSESNKINEYIMTRLRTSEGLNLKEFVDIFGYDNLLKLEKRMLAGLKNGNLIMMDNRVIIQESNWMISDKIISELFSDED